MGQRYLTLCVFITVLLAIISCVAADLSITNTGSPNPVTAGNNLTYNLTVKNNGPSEATGITLTDILPETVSYVSVTSSQGSCSQSTSTITCNLGTLNSGASIAPLTIVVKPTTAGTINNSAFVIGNEADPNTTNNVTTLSNTVNASACLSANISASPNPVAVGQTLTYTVTVTNNAPSTATGVTFNFSLPESVGLKGIAQGPGGCNCNAAFSSSGLGGSCLCYLGTIPSGTTSGTTSFEGNPTMAGVITSSATVASNELFGNNNCGSVLPPGVPFAKVNTTVQ